MKRYLFALLALGFAVALGGCDLGAPSPAEESALSEEAISRNPDLELIYGANQGGNVVLFSNNIYVKKTSLLQRATLALKKTFSRNPLAVEASVTSAESSYQPITQLPDDIKRVKNLDSSTIIYLRGTSGLDHAKELATKNIQTSEEKILYTTSDGFGIDEYVLSPDKKLAALWEVKMPRFSDGTEKGWLLGGESRIVQIDLSSGKSAVLLGPQKMNDFSEEKDEIERAKKIAPAQAELSSEACLQYPLFYDSQNRLYLDTFCPNGGGWGNGGYTIARVDDTARPYPLLTAGSYSHDPTPSSDGSFFAVMRPDKSYSTDRAGVASAQSNPSRLSLVSTQTDAEEQIPTEAPWLGLGAIISSDGNLIAYTGHQNEQSFRGGNNEVIYIYDRRSRTTKSFVKEGYVPIEFSPDGKNLIFGKASSVLSVTDDTSEATPAISNLGPGYSPAYSQYLVVDVDNPEVASEVDAPNFVEYIGGISGLEPPARPEGERDPAVLQMVAFAPRNVDLPRTRTVSQQAIPFSPVYGSPDGTPGQHFNPNNLPRCDDYRKQFDSGNVFKDAAEYSKGQIQGKCFDSPLYLYPLSEKEVTVSSKNPIFSPEPPLTKGAWHIIAHPDGRLVVEGKEYSKVAYDYAASAKPLTSGYVVSDQGLEGALVSYAGKLGLNEREKRDFISHWLERLKGTSPFYQISHYSRLESERILALSIDPRPDIFIPIVMYFKKLGFPTVLPSPHFEPILERSGFTALDWSGIVE